MSSYQKLDETQHVKNNIFLLFAQFFTLPCLSLKDKPSLCEVIPHSEFTDLEGS